MGNLLSSLGVSLTEICNLFNLRLEDLSKEAKKLEDSLSMLKAANQDMKLLYSEELVHSNAIKEWNDSCDRMSIDVETFLLTKREKLDQLCCLDFCSKNLCQTILFRRELKTRIQQLEVLYARAAELDTSTMRNDNALMEVAGPLNLMEIMKNLVWNIRRRRTPTPSVPQNHS